MRIQVEPSAIRFTGEELIRPEGVAASRNGDLYTSDVRGHVNIISPDGSRKALGRLGGRPNGICLDECGAIIVANIGNGQLQRLTPDGKHTLLAETVDGRRMWSPNFPCVDRHHRIWCSNSSARPDLQEALREARPDGCVFRLDGERAEIVADGLVFANGIALDGTEEHLYVAETLACRILKLRIEPNGKLADCRQYGPVLGERGQPDGIAFDSAGNLWVTLVWDAALGVIYPDESYEVVLRDLTGALKRPSNICFGGPDLRTAYVGSLDGDNVPCFEIPSPGLPLPHQR